MSIFSELTSKIREINLGHPIRVGVSGITGCGKSTFADHLAESLRKSGRKVTRGSIDWFHNPRSKRYERGKKSAEGYYLDAHDYNAFKKTFLEPLGSPAPYRYSLSSHDLERDIPATGNLLVADPDEIFIVDGTFLFKEQLLSLWDYRIFLDTKFEVALERGVSRDQVRLGGRQEAIDFYQNRYHKACQFYLGEHNPKASADIIVSNNDRAL